MNNPFLVCSDRELRALPAQWLRAECWEKAGRLLYNLEFMEANIRRLGIDELQKDYFAALRLLPGEDGWRSKLAATNRALSREAHHLRAWKPDQQTNFFLQQMGNISLELGLDELHSDTEVLLAKWNLPYLRHRFKINSESDGLVRTLKAQQWDLITDSVAISGNGGLAVSAHREFYTWSAEAVGITECGRAYIDIWDMATGQNLHTLELHSGSWNKIPITSEAREDEIDLAESEITVAITSDGRQAVSATLGEIKTWNLATLQLLRTLKVSDKWWISMAVNSDGRLGVSISADSTLKVWDLESGQLMRMLEGHTDKVTSVAITPDGSLVISASPDKTIKVWNTATGICLRTINTGPDRVESLAVTPDGRLGVAASADSTLKAWDLESGQLVRTLEGHTDKVTSVAITSDGSLVISASLDKTIKAWNLATGKCLRTMKGHVEGIKCMAITSDGQYAISGTAGLSHASNPKAKDGYNVLLVWDILTGLKENLATKQELDTPREHANVVTSVAVTADGRLGVSASADSTLKVWDLESGQLVRTLEGHTDKVTSVAITSDGSLVISASLDKTIKVWNLATGLCLRTINMDPDHAEHLAVTPDGRKRAFLK